MMNLRIEPTKKAKDLLYKLERKKDSKISLKVLLHS